MDINEEQIAFYSEIGHAITQWAYVEFALARIVATRFEKKNAQNAGHVTWANRETRNEEKPTGPQLDED